MHASPTVNTPFNTHRLKYFEEVFTSQHWMVRIYRVLPQAQRSTKLRNPHRVKIGKKGKKGKRV